MTIEQYSSLALVTQKPGTINEIVTHHLFGMVGEWFSEIQPELELMTKEEFIDEMGDFMWYFVGYMRTRSLDFDFVNKHVLDAVYNLNVNTLIGSLVEYEKKVIFYDKVNDDFRYPMCSYIYHIINHNMLPKFNVTFSEIFEYNINKLRKRFPDGFNELDAQLKKELHGEQ